MIKIYKCDYCGIHFECQECFTKGKQHLFCSRRCGWDFGSKSKNPNGYRKAKNLKAMSEKTWHESTKN